MTDAQAIADQIAALALNCGGFAHVFAPESGNETNISFRSDAWSRFVAEMAKTIVELTKKR